MSNPSNKSNLGATSDQQFFTVNTHALHYGHMLSTPNKKNVTNLTGLAKKYFSNPESSHKNFKASHKIFKALQ